MDVKTIKIAEYGYYNDRRYGMPWAAKVSLDNIGKMKYDFCGNYTGKKGEPGKVLISIKPGDIIATGQKDNRGKSTSITYYSVNDDFTLTAETKKSICERISV